MSDGTQPPLDQPDGFAQFDLDTFERVAAFAVTLSDSRDEAFDLAQEAFVRTWSRQDHIRPDALQSYVMTTVANLAFSRLRRRARLERILPRTKDEAATVDHADQVASRLDLRNAMLRLPRRQHTIVALSYFADMSADQVATQLGISPATVRVHLARARSRLAESVGDAGRKLEGDSEA